MAVTRDRLTRDWLLSGDIRAVRYEQVNSDGLWMFLIECFFPIEVDQQSTTPRAILVTRDGQEILANHAHWHESASRYQRRAYVYVKGPNRTFFIDLCEFDIFQLIVEQEQSSSKALTYYN
jgi:hypothetical protein